MPGGRPSRDAIYRRLDEAVRELTERLGGLPSPNAAEDIWVDIWHQEAHNSTAIEGNTLILSEVTRLLDEGRVTGDKRSPSTSRSRATARPLVGSTGRRWGPAAGPTARSSRFRRFGMFTTWR